MMAVTGASIYHEWTGHGWARAALAVVLRERLEPPRFLSARPHRRGRAQYSPASPPVRRLRAQASRDGRGQRAAFRADGMAEGAGSRPGGRSAAAGLVLP